MGDLTPAGDTGVRWARWAGAALLTAIERGDDPDRTARAIVEGLPDELTDRQIVAIGLALGDLVEWARGRGPAPTPAGPWPAPPGA